MAKETGKSRRPSLIIRSGSWCSVHASRSKWSFEATVGTQQRTSIMRKRIALSVTLLEQVARAMTRFNPDSTWKPL
jgi:hypothetical protein